MPSACRYRQNPQLEGVNRNRLLFGGRVRRVSSRQSSQLSRYPSSFGLGIQSGHFVLDAGTTQGITTGARCEVYWDKNSTSGTPLGALVVSQVSPSSATLAVPPGQPQFAIPPSAVAKLVVDVELGQKDALHLFVSRDRPLLDLVKRSIPPSLGVQVVFVDDEIRAHLCFSKVGRTIKCRIVQAHYNFTRDWQGVDINSLEEMSTFIRYAAHFHRYLSLNCIDNNPEMIQVEIFELELSPNSRECRPIGNNLNTNNNIDMVVDAETMHRYGIKITNKTDQNLYPHVFYFDNGDFSIGKLILLLAHDVLLSNNLRMPL